MGGGFDSDAGPVRLCPSVGVATGERPAKGKGEILRGDWKLGPPFMPRKEIVIHEMRSNGNPMNFFIYI
jgi:hypothetical protein